ncbi:MAG TPA: hypothetical protein VIM51_05325 [Desulfosporosinus sp.]
MAKNNKTTGGSKGIWTSLEQPSNPQPKPEPQSEQQNEISRNLDLNKNSSDCRKPKRYSSKNGEEFTVSKGIVLTKEINRKLNLVKALSENLTYNEIVDEALQEYCDKRLKRD